MASFPVPATAALQQAFGLITKTVLAAPAAAITFSGIDTANKMFRLSYFVLKDATPADLNIRFNNDVGANYDYERLDGAGAAVNAARVAAQTLIDLDARGAIAANGRNTGEVLVAKQQAGDEAMIVASHVFDKNGDAEVSGHIAAIWNDTGALISRIDLLVGAGNMDTDTVAILEGNETT